MAQPESSMELAGLGELEATIARSDELQEYLSDLAEQVVAKAQQLATERLVGHRNPDDPDPGGTPYADSFATMLTPYGKYMAALAYNTAYDAAWVELGVHPHGDKSTIALGVHIMQDALRAVAGSSVDLTVRKKGKLQTVKHRRALAQSKTRAATHDTAHRAVREAESVERRAIERRVRR